MCVIDLFSKHGWVFPLKDKRGISIVNAFQKIVSKGRNPNKIWVDQGGKFYNNLFERLFKINNIEMYSTYNEVKSVVSKNICFDVLDDIVNKYNKTAHRAIKMKSFDVLILMLNTINILM